MRRLVAVFVAVSFLAGLFLYLPTSHARKIRVLSKPPEGLKLPAGVVIAKPAASAPQAKKCAKGYRFLPQDYRESSCYNYIQPKEGNFLSFDMSSMSYVMTVDGQQLTKISGGYTCRFKNDLPPDGICPLGAKLTRWNAALYSCGSDHPLSEEEVVCINGYVVKQRGAKGFSCEIPGRLVREPSGSYSDSKVCVGSMQLKANIHNDYCCVYSK
jgi:hypothetical protein